MRLPAHLLLPRRWPFHCQNLLIRVERRHHAQGQRHLVDGMTEAQAVKHGDLQISQQVVDHLAQGLGGIMTGRWAVLALAHHDPGRGL